MSLPGQILYQLWHRPVAAARDSIRRGGPLVQWRAARGRTAMQAAALALPPPPARVPGVPFSVHLLTGRRFAYQTVFCLHTLARHCPAPLAPELYDDGTFDAASRGLVLRLFPGATIHPQAETIARLDSALPAARFPVLRERWANYPHIRKLTDVHAGRVGWRLVLDSDLLFWREPRLLLDWASAPDRPLLATDCEENYGYPRPVLERLAGRPVPARLNVGLCGFRSDALDWEFLEHAAGVLIREHGTSYYLEQGLCALLAARHPGGPLQVPFADYLTMPDAPEVARPTAAMHHYVDLSRDTYHIAAWRRALEKNPPAERASTAR